MNVQSLRDGLARRDPVRWLLAVAVATWAVTFFVLAAMRHRHFGPCGFDLGIYDQGVWLLSHGKDPFVTIRGLEFFGHHMNVALLLLAPGYWLGGGPLFLLAVQVLAQASGGAAGVLLAPARVGARG